jgi:hypothetical protein
LLDNFPDLRFKAYLTARAGDEKTASRENLYAPFYVWEKAEGLNNFVGGPGFAGVSASFGRPRIRTWVVWETAISANIRAAKFATRELVDVGVYEPLDELRKRESEAVTEDIEAGNVLAAVTAFEPTGWTRVRFRLWQELPDRRLLQVRWLIASGTCRCPDETERTCKRNCCHRDKVVLPSPTSGFYG